MSIWKHIFPNKLYISIIDIESISGDIIKVKQF